MKRITLLLTAVFASITFGLFLSTILHNPVQAHVNTGNLAPLVPAVDYGDWYEAATGYAPDATYFGAYAIMPLTDTLYLGFGTARPSEADGALLAQTDGVTVTAVHTLTEQGFLGLTAVDNTLHIPGVDPCCGDGWDFGNSYIYTPSVAFTKLRNIPDVIHSWGMWAAENGDLYIAVSSPAATTNVGGSIAVSHDSAQSWTTIANRDDGVGYDRTYDILGLNGNLYATWSDAYTNPCGVTMSEDDGQNWTRLAGLQTACRPRLFAFNDTVLALRHDLAAMYAIRDDGTIATHPFPNFTVMEWAYNYATVDGAGWLYLVTADGRVVRTRDMTAWQTIADTDLELISIAHWPHKNWLVLSDRGSDAKLWKIDLNDIPTVSPKYIILMIADGWGANQIAAANAYVGTSPAYQSWPRRWVSTFPAGGSYDSTLAWSDFEYVKAGYTDSAAAATALYTGVKTENGRVSTNHTGDERLVSITELARQQGRTVGTVSSVYISHATPGAWMAHNQARGNGYAIADEGYWGDPNTTGSGGAYNGGMGPTIPPVDVIIGAGHPAWQGRNYVNSIMRDKLASESGQAGAFTFVERQAGNVDGGVRLLVAANLSTTTRLAGLFGGTGGNLEYRLADGSGHNPENPTLAEMAEAALLTLNRSPNGFVLMVEGGAVDWGGHVNNLDKVVGEMIGFNEAVTAVSAWVENPANGSSWENTLMIVTGDHETGYLTAVSNTFPNQPLGVITDATLALEKPIASTGRRASWEDTNGNDEIDDGETVYWAWNTGGHTNSLIPLYANGAGANLFTLYATGTDVVRGRYVDNTAVFQIMDAVLQNQHGYTFYFPSIQK